MSEARVTAALIVAVVGLLIPAGLVVYLGNPNWSADNVLAIIGLFTSVIGTIVGAFLGVQVGAAGKEKADDNAAKAQKLANAALGKLPPEAAEQVRESVGQ